MNKETAKTFVYRNARPIQLALWKYYFEGGSREEVIHLLSFYQNQDGGFGNGIEADNLSPASSPMQTWKATEILWEIGCRDSELPMIQGILKWLDSRAEYAEKTKQWKNCVQSTNGYPHAIWWEYNGEPAEYGPNPTASLAGFILFFADKNSALYQKGVQHAKDAYAYLEQHFPIMESHIVTCYIQLYDYCKAAGAELFDMEHFKEMLVSMVKQNICPDVEKWGVDYVPTPMDYISSPASIFYAGNEELVKKDIERLNKQQLPDGSFIVPWNWCNDYKEFVLVENWLKSEILINNLLFIENFTD